jgi:hypothetical protein
MSKSFHEIRERLLRAGVAPRHVRRYLRELDDHLADLIAEEERAGRSGADAEAAALARLGDTNELARAMLEQPQFRSLSARAPWTMASLAPLVFLSAAYFIACFILWSGWRIFLPGAATPFGVGTGGPIYGLENIYFQTGKMIYFGAPILAGWTIALIAARQRLRAIWPAAGVVVTAFIGCLAQVRIIRPSVPGGVGHVTMGVGLGHSLGSALLYALATVSMTLLPYFIWRIQRINSLAG